MLIQKVPNNQVWTLIFSTRYIIFRAWCKMNMQSGPLFKMIKNFKTEIAEH